MRRWRGRRLAGLAMVAVLAASAAVAVTAARDPGRHVLVVRDADGVELARADLPSSGTFALRYRNSLYRSLAEEHFHVEGDRLQLVALAADELAVLEEYYTAVGGERNGASSRRKWTVAVERPPNALPLRIQATALGERTLLTSTAEIQLWRLVANRDDTLVLLSVEEAE
jgi:hypothetical protein